MNSSQKFKIFVVIVWAFLTLLNLIFCFINKEVNLSFKKNEDEISYVLGLVGILEHFINPENRIHPK